MHQESVSAAKCIFLWFGSTKKGKKWWMLFVIHGKKDTFDSLILIHSSLSSCLQLRTLDDNATVSDGHTDVNVQQER